MNEKEKQDLIATKKMVDRIVRYKNELSTKLSEKLTLEEKLWLLAFETSEAKIPKMGSQNTEIEREKAISSMVTLFKCIPFHQKVFE